MNQLFLFDTPSSGAQITSPNRIYWKIFVDGASRNNPGVAGAGIYILKNDVVAYQHGYYLGIKTNNQAEYLALVIGLIQIKKEMAANDFLMILSDSQLLVRQIQGAYKVKNELLKPLHCVVKKLLTGVQYDIAHVMREENGHADALANKGIDKKILLKQDELGFLREHEISL